MASKSLTGRPFAGQVEFETNNDKPLLAIERFRTGAPASSTRPLLSISCTVLYSTLDDTRRNREKLPCCLFPSTTTHDFDNFVTLANFKRL